MKKVAVIFVLAVLCPSVVLGWLAIRSLRDQQFLIERQQSLICQGLADSVAKNVQDALAEYQREFATKVQIMVNQESASTVAQSFDDRLRNSWSLAEVGFAVNSAGEVLAPTLYSRPEAKKFLTDNTRFLASRETAEVYLNFKQLPASNQQANAPVQNDSSLDSLKNRVYKGQTRNVVPQQSQELVPQKKAAQGDEFSKFAPAEAEFRQLIRDQAEGTIARFVDNKLNLLFWCRTARDPKIVFGALVSLRGLEANLRQFVEKVPDALQSDVCLALLDDNARPISLSQANFKANWKRPFVASELGESLPHWEVAVYLLNPAKLERAAHSVKLTLGSLITLLLMAIATGGWLIVSDLRRELILARQKTDFVSNVSHELKTPLTSIRMFSELLAEGRVQDPAKQQSYLGIITAEAARLTRLINNVLDFARLERGEKKYHFQPCDLGELTREVVESYRPHLEANGFRLECAVPGSPVKVMGDRDALAQIVVNLLSNAEKYSTDRKEVSLELRFQDTSPRCAELRVTDHGVGVPGGCEEKIFEKFFRAHDSLSSGIQGSGLGLTLARQIARAHGGEVLYESHLEVGSCFVLRLPLAKQPPPSPNENKNPGC